MAKSKRSVNICVAAKLKSTKCLGVTYRTLFSNAKTCRNDFDNKRNEAYFLAKKNETDLGIQRTGIPERPREVWDFDAMLHCRTLHVHPILLVKAKKL